MVTHTIYIYIYIYTDIHVIPPKRLCSGRRASRRWGRPSGLCYYVSTYVYDLYITYTIITITIIILVIMLM